ncbi:hypothetical protein RI129_008908 [Pyrocoelia pectoralis]|uniref:Uncharacterized protein n=1 Tax=Pyrocoelia pectoralis TaxID=417401 RepID=A0AAN7ZLH1_9COLE
MTTRRHRPESYICQRICHSNLSESESIAVNETPTRTSPSTSTRPPALQNRYVIRTVVYEVGILTDADNSTDSDESYEEVDLRFFDGKHNGSTFDLSKIPLPIERNFSEIVYSEILPGSFGPLVDENGTTTVLTTSNFPQFVINQTST